MKQFEFKLQLNGVVLTAAILVACAPATVAQRKPAPVQSYKVIATFPHDTSSFTQGLVFASDGQMYESTGLQGESTLRRVDIASGKTLQRIDVPAQYFAEGLAMVGDELLQLTWQHKLGFVYDRKTFKQKRTFTYPDRRLGHRLRRRVAAGDERRQRHADLSRSKDLRAREEAARRSTRAGRLRT